MSLVKVVDKKPRRNATKILPPALRSRVADGRCFQSKGFDVLSSLGEDPTLGEPGVKDPVLLHLPLNLDRV